MENNFGNVGMKKNAPEINLNRKDFRHKKEVKETREESMIFVRDNRKKKKTWTITEYKDGTIGKTLKKIETVN